MVHGFSSARERLAACRRRMCRALASRVRELNAELGHAVPAAEIDHALERRFVVVAVQAEAAMRDAPDRRDVRCLGHDQSGRAHRELAQMHEMPVVREPCSELYWHIGETTMRLGSVRPRSWSGAKRALVMEELSSG